MRSRKFCTPEQLGLPWHGPGLLAGVDEAGRGPLAGPVVAAAVMLDELQPIKGLADHEAAAREAYEEAGLIGRIGRKPVGRYRYLKIRTDGLGDPVEVLAFRLKVDRVEKRFPEEGQRERAWFAAPIAAGLVDEPDLQEILRAL